MSTTNYRTSDSELRAIANKIREKGRTTASLKYPDGFITALDNMHTEVLVPKTITHNGEYNPRRDDADGYNGVSVNVPNTYNLNDEGKVVSGGALAPQTTRNVSANGTYNTTGNNQTVVNVPNSYSLSDEGKVVDGGALVSQTARPQPITNNGTYQTQKYGSVTVDVQGSGSSAVLIPKTINANGTYDADDDNADGYSGVTVNVPNSYAAADEGRVVLGGALVAQTGTTKNANGTYDTTSNNEITVAVPNTYAVEDEGKVVSGGVLVGQTVRNVTENGNYDTTLNDYTTVNVPNSYSAEDEGKVVSEGELVEQTSVIKNVNGTFDTTLNNSVTVSIPAKKCKQFKLGSSDTIIGADIVETAGTNDLDYVIPVNMDGQEVTIDITKDLEIYIRFKLAQAVAPQYRLYVFGQKIPFGNMVILPEIYFEYDSYFSCYKCVLDQNTSNNTGHTTDVILRNYTELPGDTWITIKAEEKEKYDLTVTIGNNTFTDLDASPVSISFTGEYVPIIGSLWSSGDGETLANTAGTNIDISQCYIKQEGVKIWEDIPGGGAALIPKSITTNGTYDADDDSADGYSSVEVDVPNIYAAADEGKVVSGGALVAQTARATAITENGTYDTTGNNSVTVNVSGGGMSFSTSAGLPLTATSTVPEITLSFDNNAEEAA